MEDRTALLRSADWDEERLKDLPLGDGTIPGYTIIERILPELTVGAYQTTNFVLTKTWYWILPG